MKYLPDEFIELLGKSVIGQEDAKKTISIALRNRWRRMQLSGDIQKRITPKNILMIGSTGVGKTAIMRAVADLIDAPMVKVEATKFTQVGYVGASVNNMVEQLAAEGFKKFNELKKSKYSNSNDHKGYLLVKKANIIISELNKIAKKEIQNVINQFYSADVVDMELKKMNRFYSKKEYSKFKKDYLGNDYKLVDWIISNELAIESLMLALGYFPMYILENIESSAKKDKLRTELTNTLIHYFDKNKFLTNLVKAMGIFKLDGKLYEKEIRELLKSAEDKIPEDKHKYFQAYIDYIYFFLDDEAFLYDDEAEGIPELRKYKTHVDYVENMGIIFLDEIDKLGSKSSSSEDNVGKMGVQRDLLAILDGTTVETEHGNISTDNILFIAAGAFHVSSVSDLMPELLGRLPIQVRLEEMNYDVLLRILNNEELSPVFQYINLLKIDNVIVELEDGIINEIAKLTNNINKQINNMGARTLHLVVDRLFDDYAKLVATEEKKLTIRITKKNVLAIKKELWKEKNKEILLKYFSLNKEGFKINDNIF